MPDLTFWSSPMCIEKRQTWRLRFIIVPKQWYGRTRVTTCGCGVFWRQLELHWRCLIGERGRPWPWVWTLAPLILCSRPSVRPTDWWRSVGTLPWHHVPSMPIREVRLWTPNPPRFWGWAAKPDLVILRPPTGRVKWADRHAQSSTWRQPRERPRFHW